MVLPTVKLKARIPNHLREQIMLPEPAAIIVSSRLMPVIAINSAAIHVFAAALSLQ